MLAYCGLQRTAGAARKGARNSRIPVRRRMRKHLGFTWCRLEIMTLFFTICVIFLSTRPFSLHISLGVGRVLADDVF